MEELTHCDIAANGNCQPVDPALVAADGQRIVKRLRWMFMRPVARIDEQEGAPHGHRDHPKRNQ